MFPKDLFRAELRNIFFLVLCYSLYQSKWNNIMVWGKESDISSDDLGGKKCTANFICRCFALPRDIYELVYDKRQYRRKIWCFLRKCADFKFLFLIFKRQTIYAILCWEFLNNFNWKQCFSLKTETRLVYTSDLMP